MKLCSYGQCSIYETHTGICDGVLRVDIDFVYAKSSIGTQRTVVELLNEKEKLLDAVIFTHDEECVKQVYRVFCHYYLPLCGNTTHPALPSSVCQEECQMVQDKCQRTWDLAVFFIDIEPLINCSDTSRMLFPVPHCCGQSISVACILILEPKKALLFYISGRISTETMPPTIQSSNIITKAADPSNSQTVSAAVVVGVLVLVIASVVSGAVFLVFYKKRHKKKKVLVDILAV